VQEHGGECGVDRGLEVGVGEDDIGVLATELECDLLDRRRRGGHELAAGCDAAGE
jgi:hypothetical protein